MIRAALLAAALAAGPVAAQEATSAPGGVIRVLDKTNSALTDLELSAGEERLIGGRLRLRLDECRYPTGNPAGDAYALLTITETGRTDPVFRGWMIASSPALSAMEHPRYDVWALRCITS